MKIILSIIVILVFNISGALLQAKYYPGEMHPKPVVFITGNGELKALAKKYEEVKINDLMIRFKSGVYEADKLPDLGNNVDLVGQGKPAPRIIQDDPGSPVLIISGASDIHLQNLILGHAPELGSCYGSVLELENVNDITISNCELFGCGTYGIVSQNSNTLICHDTLIRDCSYGIMKIGNCSSFHFDKCRFFDNSCYDLLLVEGCTGVKFQDCTFARNEGDIFFKLTGKSSVLVADSTIKENQVVKLSSAPSILTFSTCRFIDNVFSDTGQEIIPFKIYREQIGAGKLGVFIKTQKSDKKVNLGIQEIGLPGVDSEYGVDPATIRVRRLEGEIPLLHIDWQDFEQGMGAYRSHFFLVVRENDPIDILLQDSVEISGHWGPDSGVRGKYCLFYKNGRLTLVKASSLSDSKAEDNQSELKSPIETLLRKEFLVNRQTATLGKTVLKYRVKVNDTLEAICGYFEIDKTWIVNPEVISKPGEYLVIKGVVDQGKKGGHQ